MRRIFISILSAVLFELSTSNALAQSCDDDTIYEVSDDGSIVTMLSGAVFQVTDPADRVDTALWMTSDDVLICDNKIVNKDEDGETASVRRLR